MSSYSTLLVIATDKRSTTQRYVPLQEPGHYETRDLSLSKSLDVDKCFTEVRSATAIREGESTLIEDFASTEL